MLMQDFFDAFKGSGIWRKIKGSDKNSDSLFLIFPEKACRLNYFGLLYADRYAKEICAKKIIVVTTHNVTAKSAKEMLKTDKAIKLIPVDDMQKLTKYFSLCVDLMGDCVLQNTVFISSVYPHGKAFEMLCDNNIFCEEYLVWNRIYHSKQFYVAE